MTDVRKCASLRDLRNEVDCRIEHGAESGGHLEYVRDRLDELLPQIEELQWRWDDAKAYIEHLEASRGK